MLPETIIGWDLGGAHVKAAILEPTGSVQDVVQVACPLWQGIQILDDVVGRILSGIETKDVRHAVTMTGELVDIFDTHQQGVIALANVMHNRVSTDPLMFYAGVCGFQSFDRVDVHTQDIASANWHASAALAARRVGEGLFVDIGSTTTDLICLVNNRVAARGVNDHQRLKFDELVYTGIVRTPVMALAQHVPFQGEWQNLMAEQFATTADIYRITGQLPEHADLLPSADKGEKTLAHSERRLARMTGIDAEQVSHEDWQNLAGYLAECQLTILYHACQRNLSRGLLTADAPLIGAGAGRFLVHEIARRSNRGYMDYSTIVSENVGSTSVDTADCAAAVAVAMLLHSEMV